MGEVKRLKTGGLGGDATAPINMNGFLFLGLSGRAVDAGAQSGPPYSTDIPQAGALIGFIDDKGNGGTAEMRLGTGSPYKPAALISGGAFTYYAGGTGQLINNIAGGNILGMATSYNDGTAVIEGTYGCFGSLVGGFAYAAGGGGAPSSRIQVDDAIGSIAFGQAQASGTGSYALISTEDNGSLALGNIFASGGYTGIIRALRSASFALGEVRAVTGNARIESYSSGSIALGRATEAVIEARGEGSIAGGRADVNDITTSGAGNIAWGYSGGGAIDASASNNCHQWGVGVNAVSNSSAFGGALRFNHPSAVPGVLRNGDFWEYGGDVFVRSGGVSRNMSNIP